jgi:hypothetical protein
MQQDNMDDPSRHDSRDRTDKPLTIRQTATGYWTVQREGKDVAGSMTQRGAEAERDLMLRLSRRSVRRTGARVAGI